MTNKEQQEEVIVKCEVQLQRIFFPKGKGQVESGEFAIFSANVINRIENCENLTTDTIKLKGKVCNLRKDVLYKVSCRLAETHEQYGDTYEIIFISRPVDLGDRNKQKIFLKSILNEKVVENLFEMYEDVVSLLENRDIASLSKVKGIGAKKALKMCNEYESSKDYGEAFGELYGFGLTTGLIKKLVEFYRSPSTVIDIIKTNPYELVTVDGIGFGRADSIAEKMGISGNHPLRVKGFILHVLQTEGENGRSYLYYEELMQRLYEAIGYVDQNVLQDVARKLVNSRQVQLTDEGRNIGLTKYFRMEKRIKEELMRLVNAEPLINIEDTDWESQVKISEREQGYEFTEEQFSAIETFVHNNLVALTGLAGAGKSSTAKGMTDLVKRHNIIGCALSGKASVRITEATGIQAGTIHRVLGADGREFTFNKNNRLPYDVVVIDEATMINGELFLALLEAIPNGAKVVLMGDVQQLTPIGSCQVFADVLTSTMIPIVKLTKPHRQAMRSGIIPTSIQIINQQQIFDSSFAGEQILGELQDMKLDIYKEDANPSNRILKHFLEAYNKTGNLMEIQITVPVKKRGDLCAYVLNNKVQQAINPIREDEENFEVKLDKDRSYIIQRGDKVINTKNNYFTVDEDGEECPIFNGNMGIVKAIDNDIVVIDFVGIGRVLLSGTDLDNLELAYACTVHKLQGSGFNVVIGGIDFASYTLLNAEILYTLLTRAKKYCVLVGNNSAIRKAISQRETTKKQTYLSKMLQVNN